MSSRFEALPLTAEAFDGWNRFAEESDDAWFWHTTHWMEFTEELARPRFIANLSFSIVVNSEMLAICPLILERSSWSDESNRFSCAGSPIPFPAMRSDLSSETRNQLLKFYVQRLASLAKDHGVGHVSVRVPAVARSYLSHGLPFANPLLKHGYIDLPYLTQVIELKKDLRILWGEISQGPKFHIKRATQLCEVDVWDRQSITAEKFLEYQLLHQKDAGRVTRSQRTFDLMLDWVRRGHAVLMEARHAGQAAAFALFILFGTGAYYGSSCKDPDTPDIPASHLIQWEAIRWLKKARFEWYEVGHQQFGPQWFDPASPKDVSIALFKRGFGGVTIPLVTAESFYSKSLLEQIFEKRWLEYVGAVPPEPAAQ
jgi:hypothetical protein